MTDRLRDKGWNLNSVLILMSIAGGIASAVFFVAPLRTIPDDMRGVQDDVETIQQTQAVQTEALKTLAEVAKDGRELRRDLDKHSAESNATIRRHDAELDGVRGRLERLESR
jgi:hypothetical protein